MRVLHVIDSSGLWGAEKMLLELAALQRSHGVDASVLSMGKPIDVKKDLESALDGESIPYAQFRSKTIPSFSDMRRLLGVVEGLNPDIIHSHGYKGNILFGLLLRSWCQRPMLATLHGWVSLPGAISKLRVYEMADAVALGKMDSVVVVGDGLKQHPRLRRVLRKNPSRFHIIENGISEESLAEPSAISSELEQFLSASDVIGSIGRLSEEKGYRFLLDAFAEVRSSHPDARLLIIGEGRLRSQLEKQIRDLAIVDHVYMARYLENAAALVGRFRMYVCASLSEGLPMTLLEAMRAETPIVATAVGGIPKLLQHGEGGVLVKPGDPASLTEGMRRVLSDNAAAAQRAKISKAEFLRNYSSSTMFRRYQAVYRSLLRKCS